MSKNDTDVTYICDVIYDEETGEQILQFPEELVEKRDWRINDTLSFEITTKGLVITNLSWQKRNEK